MRKKPFLLLFPCRCATQLHVSVCQTAALGPQE